MKTHKPYEMGLYSVLLIGVALGIIMGKLFIKTFVDVDVVYLVVIFVAGSLVIYFKHKNKIQNYEKILRELN